MRRLALAAALLLALATQAMAEEQAGRFALRSGGLLGLIADVQASSEEAGVGRWERRFATAGVGFMLTGWTASLSGGQFVYGYPGGGAGALPLATVALSREVTGIAGGTLSVELRRSMLWDAGQRLDLQEVRLGWVLKF